MDDHSRINQLCGSVEALQERLSEHIECYMKERDAGCRVFDDLTSRVIIAEQALADQVTELREEVAALGHRNSELETEYARLNDLYGNAISERDRAVGRRHEDNNHFEATIKTIQADLAEEKFRNHEFSTAYANERAKNNAAKVELER